MNIEGKRIWQHAAGDSGHEHVDLCLEYDVILIGPGSAPWEEAHRDWQRSDVHRFCGGAQEEMQEDDIVVLRIWRSQVYAVGVIGEYTWCDEFNDIDGWDLGHARRVHWTWNYKDDNGGTPKSYHPRRPLAMGTTHRLYQSDVTGWIASPDVPDPVGNFVYANLPIGSEDVTSEHIAEHLFEMGMASDSLGDLLDPNGEFVLMAAWYNGWPWGTTPSEHETVSHLVVPLLRILGWTPQRMALEWKKMDIVLFSRLQRNCGNGRVGANVNVVVEAKRVRNPCLSWAVSQAERYARPLENCHRLIVTDGLRYGVFTRETSADEFSIYAYLNLTRPRAEYPIYNCRGAREATLAMTPEWRADWQ